MRPLPPHCPVDLLMESREQREVDVGAPAVLPLIGEGEDIGTALVRLAQMAAAVHMGVAVGQGAMGAGVAR